MFLNNTFIQKTIFKTSTEFRITLLLTSIRKVFILKVNVKFKFTMHNFMNCSTGCFLYAEVIESTMKKQGLTDLTVNTMCAMAENGRLPKLNAVLASFQVLMRAHRGEVDCTVTTAKELDSKTMEELQAALKGFLKKGQTLHMNAKVSLK